MNLRDFGGVLIELSYNVIELLYEDLPVLLRKKIFLNELVGDVLGHEVHGGKLEGDRLLLGRLHLTLDLEPRLNVVDVQDLESWAQIRRRSLPPGLSSPMGLWIVQEAGVRIRVGARKCKMPYLSNISFKSYIPFSKLRILQD